MALGYRYWAGIGVVEDCSKALEWYESASEQGKQILEVYLFASALTSV